MPFKDVERSSSDVFNMCPLWFFLHFLTFKPVRSCDVAHVIDQPSGFLVKEKFSIALWELQAPGLVSRTDTNRYLASVLELYRSNPSVSSQSRSGCAHRLHPITPMWLMICSVLSMQSCSYESFIIFWPVVKASFWPLLEPYAFHDLMSPLENSALQAEK